MPTKRELFKKLRGNLEQYITQECKIADLQKHSIGVSDDDIIAYIVMRVKGKDLHDLEKHYMSLYPEVFDEYKLTDEQKAKIRKYVQALVDLV